MQIQTLKQTLKQAQRGNRVEGVRPTPEQREARHAQMKTAMAQILTPAQQAQLEQWHTEHEAKHETKWTK